MTTKLEQSARQALEALESCNVGNWSMAFDEFAVVEAITALREALVEQAEQEPVTDAPFSNCKYQVCDLPGQCIGEGKCHHPLKNIEPVKQAEQEPVACNCGTNPWHDCNESEGCRIKKTLGISSRPVYDQRADHHKMMLGYEIATKYGVFENKAFQLCDEMKKLYLHPVRTKDLTDDEINAFIDRAWDKQMSMPEIIRAVITADREKNK